MMRSHPSTRLVLVVLLSLLGVASVRAAEDKPPVGDRPAAHRDVDADEFERLMKEPDTVVLDVRTPAEYANAHIKGAVLINFSGNDFNEKIRALDKSKTYLVHCASGIRSAKACTKLEALDFPKLVNLEGGMKAWQKAGKPVEK